MRATTAPGHLEYAEKSNLPIKTRLIVSLATIILKIWFSTCRIKIIGQDLHDRYVTGKGGTVGATWHRNAIFLVWFFGPLRPMIMFSRSKDGELLADFAEKLGTIPVRGSSSHGGFEALKTMVDFLKKPGVRKAATVLDGPRGPRFVAKKGMLALAKEAEVPLLPIMASAWPAITIKKAWDQPLIPLPFSRVTVLYGEPWIIPKNISYDDLEKMRGDFENLLNDMMREADRDTGYRRP
ncbi:MAG: lysophospholipid acyltransferase family protein [Desulfobacterales bacterium]|nr:lysophospholipid acyltransferase family protein [Desulfobacterales bacterium]